MALTGEGEYNLNILKEIVVTDSFYELDSQVRKCQSYKGNDTFDNCTSRYFMEQMRLKCECLPYAIINASVNSGKVCCKYTVYRTNSFPFFERSLLALQKKRLHALKQIFERVHHA